ncbi:hypothetical protein C2R22_09380 [Salinigranum rubrum]|uniref:DUF7973 domain-containing protein n=1 Tax=Salinigranum rubrum TaxID=755307 RepID=A0A2I8VIW8_9EURY|nr:hypothetical protein [Salinigranum rubrum]AUV81834.1 hypothetical protein C2R22_09380 [Salinigranum rubrum]
MSVLLQVSAIIDAIANPGLLLAAFAGGAFGAALGALPAFCFTGFMVIAGEAANLAVNSVGVAEAVEAAALGAPGITGSIAFGTVFGPHVSFAGGAAAAAYAAKKGYMDFGFDYHEAKNIPAALGTQPDVLVVGGLFGILGFIITAISANLGAPWDPIAIAVVLSALAHRLVFGYDVIGDIRGGGILDMTPFEREEMRPAQSDAGAMTDGGETKQRLATEPWLPHQYEWGNVAMIGLVAGLIGGVTALTTGSAFLAFGISAASLTFLNLGVERIPVTHHMTLPASTAALAVTGGSAEVTTVAMVVAGVFGVSGALTGEVVQRVFYAHADTHWDPPASAIVVNTFFIAVLAIVGVFSTSVWIPLP